MTKHTPGPWYPGHFADDTSSCNCKAIVECGYAGGIATIHVDNGKKIADGGNDCPPLAEAKANALLIAAAPDLLAALKWYANEYPWSASRALAVIAKAEGRA